MRLEETEDLPSPPPKRRSLLKEIKWTIIGFAVLQIVLWLLFLPIVEVEVSKYEILDEDCRQLDVPNLTLCELTVRDKGMGGYYTVGAVADGHRGNPETSFIGAGEVEDFTVFLYDVIAYNCTFTIDAPKVKETKSVVQILVNG